MIQLRKTRKMASNEDIASSLEAYSFDCQDFNDRLKSLYPMVDEKQNPLPRCWSPKDKFTHIGLSQNNLRVHYKGVGKGHKDAASIRATHPIPASCGLYYFEVKIVSKGREGYMGIGLSAQGVNMNRLPGWDKNSYGYHGDDGHSFCSSGTGQPYGPTFTTGDVIGCGVNLINNTCFYTKNGHNLGVAFTDLPSNLYPTLGLQTPGEVIDTNFGQAPFLFNVEDMVKELRMKTKIVIENYDIRDKIAEWQTALNHIVLTYLVHHGYSATAESFAKSTTQTVEEDLSSIKNRQRIERLVLCGRMGEAIETTQKLYSGLLEKDQNLLFILKCRQFIEMVNGTDSEVRTSRSPKSQDSSPCMSPNYKSNYINPQCGNYSPVQSAISPKQSTSQNQNSINNNSKLSIEDLENNAINSSKCDGSTTKIENLSQNDNDVEMDMIKDNESHDRTNILNGNIIAHSNGFQNGNSADDDTNVNDESEMGIDIGNSVVRFRKVDTIDVYAVLPKLRSDWFKYDDVILSLHVDTPSAKRLLCGGNQTAIKRMLQFGKELQAMSVRLKKEFGKCETNKKMLQDAFSLLAYSDCWNSPVGYQLDPIQRERVCAALNSAILKLQNFPKRPPLETVLGHSKELVNVMSKHGLGSCAFANDCGVGKSSIVQRFVNDVFNVNVESTIGASFMTKNLIMNDYVFKFQIWDTAGQERYRSLAPMYYRGAGSAIIVYDVTNKTSFNSVKSWVHELRQHGSNDLILAIAGNKCDLEDKREVPENDILYKINCE
ncbi:Ran-binding protein 9 [Nymphon striatum]|nr:Ran-binding protein 9 [Nymphon striatum]